MNIFPRARQGIVAMNIIGMLDFGKPEEEGAAWP